MDMESHKTGPFQVHVWSPKSENRVWVDLSDYKDFPSFRAAMKMLFYADATDIFIDGIDYDLTWISTFESLGLTDIAPLALDRGGHLPPESKDICDCIHEINSFCDWNKLSLSDKEVFDAYCVLKMDEECKYLGSFRCVWLNCKAAYIGNYKSIDEYVEVLASREIPEKGWIWDYIDFERMVAHWSKNYIVTVTTGKGRRIMFDVRQT